MTADIPPAVLEAAARAMWLGKVGDCSWERCVADAPPLADRYREDARAALQAVGFEEAASIVRDLADSMFSENEDDWKFSIAKIAYLFKRAREWSSQHPESQ